jgi:cyclopropane fatty-acyl-phospholipid synthase-like methyltransferase
MELIKENKKVLELGCANGFMSEYLTEKLKCTVIAVEINYHQATVAQKKCFHCINGDIEDTNTMKKIIKKCKEINGVDIILASSILEHLVNPDQVLFDLKEILLKDGFIIVSIPNIAHWSIRRNLFFGKFNYGEYGIMDNTHLRFFTIETGRRLVEQAGYKIVHFSVEPSDFYFIPILKKWTIFGLLWRLKPDLAKAYMMKACKLIGYQMLFKAVKI